MSQYEYKTELLVRQEDIDEEAAAGWRIKQAGDYVDLMRGYGFVTEMGYEWVLFERKVNTDGPE